MKKILPILFLALFAVILHAARFDVRKYGATGDGQTDDTKAIQAAFIAAGSCGMPTGEVFFPAGTYLISNTIHAANHSPGVHCMLNVTGDQAVIRQTAPDKDIFYFEYSSKHLIDGLTFEGGRRQLKIWGNNLDVGMVTIRNCVFRDAGEFAIDDSLRKDTARPEELAVLKPCIITLDAEKYPTFEWLDESKFPFFHYTSTMTYIENCRFIRNKKAFRITSDWCFVENSEIETHPEQSGPAIVSLGWLGLENIKGLAHNNPKIKSQYWIEKLDCSNQYGVNFKNVELLTDSKIGWTAVQNYCQHGGNQNSFLIAENSRFAAANSRENALFYLHAIPNIIFVTDCTEATDRPVDIIRVAPEFSLPAFESRSRSLLIDPQQQLQYFFADNKNLNGNLPAFLRPFRKMAPSPGTRDAVKNFPSRLLSFTSMRSEVKHTVLLSDFSGSANARFQAAIAAATLNDGLSQIIIPNDFYKFTATIELPPQIILSGDGMPVFDAVADFKGPLFRVKDAQKIGFHNLYLSHASKGVELFTRPEVEAEIIFDHVMFTYLATSSIEVIAGDGTSGLTNLTDVSVINCAFNQSGVVLEHNANHASIDNCWISSDPELKSKGSIVNRGNLHLRSGVGVPMLDTIYKNGKKQDMRSNDHRWIDNYGNVFCDRFRFGGEFGGMPMVVNFSPNGTVIIRQCWLYLYEGNAARCTFVDCEELPASIHIEGNQGWPHNRIDVLMAKPDFAPLFMLTVRPGASGDVKKAFHHGLNTPLPTVNDLRKEKKSK